VASGKVDFGLASGLDSKVDSKWIFWTPKSSRNPAKNPPVWVANALFYDVYSGIGWLLDSRVDSQKITLSLARLRA
jgi:hypothetical protein